MSSDLPGPVIERLFLYSWLSRLSFLNYRAKFLAIVCLGVHLPLLAVVGAVALEPGHLWPERLAILAAATVATLAGAGLTAYVLDQLLQPVLLTARALREFRESGRLCQLPTCFDDEVGGLMTDAQRTIEHLGATLEVMASIDDVTGLPNRKRFEDLVETRISAGQRFAIGLVRFANHATLAETLGRAAADEALQIVASRLSERAECEEHLAHVAPGMFACLMPLPEADASWVASADQLRAAVDACSAGVAIGSLTVSPVLYGGLALHPIDAVEPPQLVDFAITAAAHAGAQAPVLLHSPQAKRDALERFKVEHELRRAIDREEFDLHYQPVVDVMRMRTVGAEALIRWHHPERGLQMPASFIPIAEASGLIVPMDRWVLRRACAQVREWNGTRGERLQVAINLSARQFRDPALSRHVLAAIDEFGISPDQLELELTETAAMADHEHTRRMFSQLRTAGVRIAIDDFGTGYSSMSYLRKLPFDKLKIDREFVADVDRIRHSQAICAAMIELARGMELTVLAEGTETAREVQFLADRGCTLFQGYFFSKPLAVPDFEACLDRRFELNVPPAQPATIRNSPV